MSISGLQHRDMDHVVNFTNYFYGLAAEDRSSYTNKLKLGYGVRFHDLYKLSVLLLLQANVANVSYWC